MFDYLVFPIIGLIIAFSAMAKVRKQTGSDRAAGVVGFAGFLFCLGMSGHLLYGLTLAFVISALAIACPNSPAPS